MTIYNRGIIKMYIHTRKDNLIEFNGFIYRNKININSDNSFHVIFEHRKLTDDETLMIYNNYEPIHSIPREVSTDYAQYNYFTIEDNIKIIKSESTFDIIPFSGFDCDIQMISNNVDNLYLEFFSDILEDDLFDISIFKKIMFCLKTDSTYKQFMYTGNSKKIIQIENKVNLFDPNLLNNKKFGLPKGVTNFIDYAKYIQPLIKQTIIDHIKKTDNKIYIYNKHFETRFADTLANIFVIKYIKPMFVENNEQKKCAHIQKKSVHTK